MLKSFATQARREIIANIHLNCMSLGIDKDNTVELKKLSSDAYTVNERTLTVSEVTQRNRLLLYIINKGYEEVIEEVAYTWFNRFIALRYMEVNEYLEMNILSSNENNKEPDVLRYATDSTLEELDYEYIRECKINNKTEELYKYMMIKQCNALHSIIPSLFEKINDYTELLFPTTLLNEDSIIRKLVELDVEDFKNTEIIGWLYQYYISEKKDEVFANLKKNIKISKENIPAATQLFTPKWIVKYMVENSLGRLWLEGHSDRQLQSKWEYYLEEGKQEEQALVQLNRIKEQAKDLNIENIKFLEPCAGSGHILIYAFEVFYDIYLTQGYSEREIPTLILEKNLYGLDIDDRAAQLANFALLMKARSYSRRVFKDQPKMNIYAIQESNTITEDDLVFFIKDTSLTLEDMNLFINEFKDAKEFGSLLSLTIQDYKAMEQRIETLPHLNNLNLFEQKSVETLSLVLPSLLNQAKIMTSTYDVVVTNPPYMGSKGMSAKISDYLNKNFKENKSDLFSAFVMKCFNYGNDNAHFGYMTPFVWMFIKSYEDMRKEIISKHSITSLVQLEYSGFDGATVPICTYTLRNKHTNIKGEYIRLSDFKGSDIQGSKTLEAAHNRECGYRYGVDAEMFSKIPGSPIAYWLNNKIYDAFANGISLGDISEIKIGLQTGDNELYLRRWPEVSIDNICFNSIVDKAYWVPYNKGGSFRKWFGNNEYLVNWKNEGSAIKSNKSSYTRNVDYYFKPGYTWSDISSGQFSMRTVPIGFMFDTCAPTMFNCEEGKIVTMILNSKIGQLFLNFLTPTLHYAAGSVGKFPVCLNDLKNINEVFDENVELCKKDWDSFETSWDFKKHPFNVMAYKGHFGNKGGYALMKETGDIMVTDHRLEYLYEMWDQFTTNQFNQLKENEEELNRIFIDIYGLQDELTPEVEDKDVTIRKADLERDIKSLLSYAIGCMVGRYSLDEEGLVYAGGEFDSNRYKTYLPDLNNIVPFTEDYYFSDDVVDRIVEFIKVVYSSDTLEENLEYIATALGTKGTTSREVIRSYMIKEFYKDHVKMYSKRPIYWMFSSGKEGAFKALIYMHRYDSSLLARLRNDYVLPTQNRIEEEMKYQLSLSTSSANAKEKTNANKEYKRLEKQYIEIKKYDEVLHHYADQRVDIDLDDGVVVNYAKFGTLVEKIK